MIAWIIGFSVSTVICLSIYLVNKRPYKNEPIELPEPFAVSEYFARMEKAALDNLESNKPVNKTIILWWGLDGLRLNEDGTTEWIIRKKEDPAKQDVFYQPCQTRTTFVGDMCQSTQETIDALMAQTAMQTVNARLQLLGYPRYYPSYLYGWIMTGYAHPRYLSQMQNCCCSRLI